MRNVLGNSLTLTLFGESHNNQIGVVLDGLVPGYKINNDLICEALEKRKPNDLETKRHEKDEFKIISGEFNGYTTGGPLTIIMNNQDINSSNYQHFARPSHVDYVSYVKYHGYEDFRGGGHFSGRLTAPIVAAGAIIADILLDKNIKINSSIVQIGNLVNPNEKEIKQLLSSIKDDNDSIGGKITVSISGVPIGIGEPWFSSLEGELSKAMFAIGGVKGIEFGDGFGFVNQRGSDVKDEYAIKNNMVHTLTNHNGGINGGISNGNDIVFSLAIKPTPSFNQSFAKLDLENNVINNDKLNGRFDCCIVRRIMPVAEALAAIVIYDLLQVRFGEEYFVK